VDWAGATARPPIRWVLRQPVSARLGLLAVYGVVLLAIGGAAGAWSASNNLGQGVAGVAARLFAPPAEEASELSRIASQTVEWRPLQTSLHDLETASIALAPFDTLSRGGAIEEIEGNIVFVSPVGQIGYLTPGLELRAFDLRVDLGLAALRSSEVFSRPGFLREKVRVLDLLAVDRGAGEYDLYVSHHRFADECFAVAISRVSLAAEEGGLRVISDLEPFFTAEPCLPPREAHTTFEGNQTGGRMVQRGENTLLLTVGDADFNGVNEPPRVAQDPSSDYGKVLEINLGTGARRIFSMGNRNPQGLLVTRDGVVWETEHGPQGGDEINIIRDGGNYGWPYATYGVDYAFNGPRRGWPLNPEQGRHDGYDEPAFAFVPSIGISNIIQPDPREFPLWRDHLVLGSLYRERSLYLVRVTGGDRVAYIEPVRIEKVVRDLLVLENGQIALLTDDGELMLIRNAENPQARPRPAELFVTLSSEVTQLLSSASTEGCEPEAWGKLLFAYHCIGCHSMAGATGIGPPLDGVVGRNVGQLPGYAYSLALTGHGGQWTRRELLKFLTDPGVDFDGTTMPAVPLNEYEAAALVDFLEMGEAAAP
jgi:cytochrome c2